MKPISEQLQADIIAYVEGILPASEAARIEMVLANGDPELHQLVRGMIDDRGVVLDLPRPKAPEDLAGRIMEHVERNSLLGTSVDHQLAHEHRQWFSSRLAIAAGLLLVVGGFSYFIVDSIMSPVPDELHKWAAGKPVTIDGTAGAKSGGQQLAMGGPTLDKAVSEKSAFFVETLPNSGSERLLSAALAPTTAPGTGHDEAAPHGDALAFNEPARLRGAEALRDAAPPASPMAGAPAVAAKSLKSAESEVLRLDEANKTQPRALTLAKKADTDAAEGAVLLPRAEAVNNLAAAQPVVLTIRARSGQEVTELRKTLTTLGQSKPGIGLTVNTRQMAVATQQLQNSNNGAQALTYGGATNNNTNQDQRASGSNGVENNATGSANNVVIVPAAPPFAPKKEGDNNAIDKLAKDGQLDRKGSAASAERPVEIHRVVLSSAQLTGLLNQYAWTHMTQGQTIYDNPPAATGTAVAEPDKSRQFGITANGVLATTQATGHQMPVPQVIARRLKLNQVAQQDNVQAIVPSATIEGGGGIGKAASAVPSAAGARPGGGGEQAKDAALPPLTCIIEVLAPEPATGAQNP